MPTFKHPAARRWLNAYIKTRINQMDETLKEIEQHLNRIKEIAEELNNIADGLEINKEHSAKGYPKPRDVYY